MEMQMTNQLIAKSSSNNMNIENIMLQKAVKQDMSIQSVKEYMRIDPSYQPTVQEKTIIKAIEAANEKLMGADREFEFSVHEKTKQIMVRVLDKGTKEVIREIPSEKILDYVAAMCESAGLFVDEKR